MPGTYPPQQPPYPPYPPQQPPASQSPAVTLGLLAIGIVGAALALFTQVSLASGTGTVWVGAALAGLAAVGSYLIPGTPKWLKVTLTIAACCAIAGGIYDEHQLSVKREQLQQILDQLP
jgi:hypothetical protein